MSAEHENKHEHERKMKLKSISYTNLKGRSETVELGTANLVTGRNFSGKTTIIDALKLALLGYHPSLDKTPRGVFELSSGGELAVTATFDNGDALTRSWKAATNGAIKSDQFSRSKDGSVPRLMETPVVLLDANEYFGKSDRGKVEMIFASCKVKGALSSKQIADELASQFSVDQDHRAGSTTQAFVEFALSSVERRRSEAAESVRRMRGTLQGLSTLKLSDEIKPVKDDVLKVLERKQRELEAAQEKVNDAKRLHALLAQGSNPMEEKLKAMSQKRSALSLSIQDDGKRLVSAERRWKSLLDGAKELFCEKCKANAEKAKSREVAAIERERMARQKEEVLLTNEIAEAEPKAKKARDHNLKVAQRKIDESEEVMAGIRQEMADAEKEQRRYLSEQQDRKRLKEAREELDKAELDEKHLNGAKKYLLEVKAKMVEEMFKPILTAARYFTAGIFEQPLQFSGGELGMVRGKPGVFYSHRTFSGTEQAIAFAALQAALAATAPVKLVVMDELDKIDDANTETLMRNIGTAIRDGVISQFIGVSTSRWPTPKLSSGESFKVIER